MRKQRAEVNGQEQYIAPWPRLGHARRPGKTANPAATAKPEDRQSLYIGPEAEALHEARLKARDCEAGDCIGDDGVNVAQIELGFGYRLGRDPLQEVEPMALE